MTVIWSDTAKMSRVALTRNLAKKNPLAARNQNAAIRRMAASLDGAATYQELPNGAYYVPVPGYPLVILYDRDPANGDATILDVVPSRSDWKPGSI